MSDLTYNEKYCVVGAGSSGLAAAKNLKEQNIPFDVLEREDDVGGLWNWQKPFSAVYKSTHLISSKPLTEFTDFPMPEDYPDYPNHAQVLEYMRAYARKFGLYSAIQFNTEVKQISANGDHWRVVLKNDETRAYRGVIVATGHLWNPNYPDYPGPFNGMVLHSKQYKTPDILHDRRVLVVGAGNSGCDIAVESAQNAACTFHSVRRGYHYIPKYLFGKPADQVGELSLQSRLPIPVRRFLNGSLLKVLRGTPEKFGLPKPDHKLFESHPIVNSQIFYYLGHGDIVPRPDVAELCGDHVLFKDGSKEKIDVIIYATGYRISFPFLETKYLNWQNGRPEFYLNVFHPEFDNLFMAGLIQPDSGQWWLVDYQMQLVARFIRAQDRQPSKANAFRKLKRHDRRELGGGIHYLRSTRHYLEIEHFSYSQYLKKLIRKLS